MHKNAIEAVRSALPQLSDIEAERAVVAVLKAVREPTRAMLKNAAKCLTYEHRPELRYLSNSEKHKVRFQAMIDAALGVEIPNRRTVDGAD